MPLSDNIKKFRKLRKLSVTAMAKELGVSRQTIYDWENGKYPPPLDKLDKLGTLLGVDKSILLGGEGTPDDLTGDNKEIREVQRKYILMLENEVERYKRIVETLRLRLIEHGLDASTPD